jgi:hypothetical protein
MKSCVCWSPQQRIISLTKDPGCYDRWHQRLGDDPLQALLRDVKKLRSQQKRDWVNGFNRGCLGMARLLGGMFTFDC